MTPVLPLISLIAGDHHIALQARLMGQALRKLTASVSRTGATLVFINQLRSKVGVIFGSPEITPGGNALKFYSSVRLEIRRVGPLKRDGEIVGNMCKVKVAKNKVAPPFREAFFDIEFGKGISKLGEVLDLGIKKGILTTGGSWIYYGETSLGQGREKAKQALAADSVLFETLQNDIASTGTGLPEDENTPASEGLLELEAAEVLESAGTGSK